MVTERDQEKQQGRGQAFWLPVPGEAAISPEREKPIEEKTALWVPYQEIIKQGFAPSKNWPEVQLTRDVIAVLRTIARGGQISFRNELEDDPEKQQVIFYTAVTCRNHLLWYQRAEGGDERLRGKYSIGVGGHKTKDDILSVEGDFLDEALPVFADELRLLIGTNRGLLAEVEEEIGVSRNGFTRPPRILGAFVDRRNVAPEDSRYQHPVGFVHLAIPTLIEISPEKISQLRFFQREIAWADWVPLEQATKKLEEVLQSPWGVDSWTEIFIKEFLADLPS